jgi:DNA-binding SARP family transcriptional activator/TolB-like protein
MIRIQTFGGLTVRGDDGRPLAGSAAQPRRMVLLGLLAAAGDRGVLRDRLIGLLWPDTEEERARNNLAQALYALRRDLGDDTLVGTNELRLDADRVSSDVADFRAALSRGNKVMAAELYAGNFLDGFHLTGTDELERWIEEERRALAHEYARVLESLAQAADARGDHVEAVGWWRKLAAADPLNGRVAIGLMEALTAIGDRAGALQHARIYQVLLEQELDLPPDRDVVQLADRLRRAAEEEAAARTAPEPAPHGAVFSTAVLDALPAAAPAPPSAGTQPTVLGSWRLTTAVVAGAFVAVAVAIGLYLTRSARFAPASRRVVAVGRISTYQLGNGEAELTAPLADLLATNLARLPELRVVSAGRMLELISRAGRDTGPAAAPNAARAAGATELIDGTLYGLSGGRLRLDLRRVDLATGSIVDARTVEGPDLFALVDSGTAQIATRLGASAPKSSVAQVTTRSPAAYRLYTEALGRYYALEWAEAERLLAAAVAEDSTFAMATYYWAKVTPDVSTRTARMARAVRLSSGASDRERLTIRAGAALELSSPDLAAIAETLATRYPDEVYGHLYRGAALVMAQDFLAAVPHLRRAMEMDSTALGGSAGGTRRPPTCAGCDARSHLVYAYWAADSLAAAVREGMAWTRWSRGSPAAWLTLAPLLSVQGRIDAAQQAIASARAALDTIGGGGAEARNAEALGLLYARDYARAEQWLRVRSSGVPADQREANWYLTILYREQGRLDAALGTARRYRALMAAVTEPSPDAIPGAAVLEALVLDDMGRHRQAAALFDSIGQTGVLGGAPSYLARNRAWMMTQAAAALAAAGDTAGLMARADSVAAYGARSGLGRDQRLFHYVQGLVLAGRRDDAAAVEELRVANRSPTMGFTRANADRARALLRLGRAADAVRALQPTLRGGIDGSNLYISRTELHELLAQAWQVAGGRDSAVAHYGIVAKTWAAGDAVYRARATAAASRAAMVAKR